MKIYDHKYMELLENDGRVDFIWKADTKDMNDYDNAFMKSYEEAVGWLNS